MTNSRQQLIPDNRTYSRQEVLRGMAQLYPLRRGIYTSESSRKDSAPAASSFFLLRVARAIYRALATILNMPKQAQALLPSSVGGQAGEWDPDDRIRTLEATYRI